MQYFIQKFTLSSITTDLSDVVVPDVEETGAGPVKPVLYICTAVYFTVPVNPRSLEPTQRGQGVIIEDESLQVLVVGV